LLLNRPHLGNFTSTISTQSNGTALSKTVVTECELLLCIYSNHIYNLLYITFTLLAHGFLKARVALVIGRESDLRTSDPTEQKGFTTLCATVVNSFTGKASNNLVLQAGLKSTNSVCLDSKQFDFLLWLCAKQAKESSLSQVKS